MFALTEIAAIPGSHNSEYFEAVRNQYKRELAPTGVKYQENGTPVIPWKQASDIMVAQLSTMKKIMGH